MVFETPKMPTPEELAKQQTEKNQEQSANIDIPKDLMEKFDVTIESLNIPDEERINFREDFSKRASGKPEKVVKAVMGQILLQATKRARELKG